MAAQPSGSSDASDGLQMAVLRYSDGRVVKGYMPKRQGLTSAMAGTETLSFQDPSGVTMGVDTREIKAIFLVKSFEGNPNYLEYKNFPERPGDPGLWIRVRFKDNEILEGVAPNSLATFIDPIFYMTPPDPLSNNQGVLVSKVFLADMQVLGFEESRH